MCRGRNDHIYGVLSQSGARGKMSGVRVSSRLCEHLMFRHFRSKVAVVKEGKEPFPRCDMCRIHMPEGRIIRHRRMARCDRNTQMRWRQQDVAVANKCLEATFSLTGKDEAEHIEGVWRFKYLGRLMDRSDNNCPAVLHNISKAR